MCRHCCGRTFSFIGGGAVEAAESLGFEPCFMEPSGAVWQTGKQASSSTAATFADREQGCCSGSPP